MFYGDNTNKGNIMERMVDTYLKEWVQSKNRKPLIIRGARQVGKTYSVDKLGLSFKHYVKVDFEETPSLKNLFDGDLDVKKITAEIDFLIENNPIIPVEVKSDKAGRLRSMHQALLQFKNIPYGVVLSTRNVEMLEKQRLKFLPLYCGLR